MSQLNIPHKQGGPSDSSVLFRKTEQFLMPLAPEMENSGYDLYPVFKYPEKISVGYDTLADYLLTLKKDVLVDGYVGVLWNEFRNGLNEAFLARGISVCWINASLALKESAEVDRMIESNVCPNDALFGKIFEGELADFFDNTRLAELPQAKKGYSIIYGSGAFLSGGDSVRVYIDVPKNEIQFRSRAGRVCNLGARVPVEPKAQYKHFYFIDWPVLNRHKAAFLPQIDIFLDEQRVQEITWTRGAALRTALRAMSTQVFRPRPWFEPGVWGGQWIKERIKGLNKEVPNYAWSFELIAPENGIVFSDGSATLEVSLDTLLFQESQAVLGKAARRFGSSFPIRFDFLDTFAGGNLSLQCHPSDAYTRENFGENYTQDETYYILDAEADAQVYLGFQDSIEQYEFKAVLENSFAHAQPVDVKKYVQTFPARKHDLFLIPNGTVHCSGQNTMVLEISATPYIFTFKMYDWLRPDLNGKPRTLNVERAFENLDFSRKGDVVSQTLLSRQTLVEQGLDFRVISLSTHPQHFYAVERLEFETEISRHTLGQCQVMSLVEGSHVRVICAEHVMDIHYAETFIVPAAAHSFILVNMGDTTAKVIKAFVKDDCC